MDREQFVERVNKALAEAWKSEGSISINVADCDEQHIHVMICPAIREVYGGKDDGNLVYANFYVDYVKFQRVFDKGCRRVAEFNSGTNMPITGGMPIPYFYCRGKIMGEKVDFTFLATPPPYMKPSEKHYLIGPKAGQIETIQWTETEE